MTTPKNEAERIAILMKTPEQVRKGIISTLRAIGLIAGLSLLSASAQAGAQDGTMTCADLLQRFDIVDPVACVDTDSQLPTGYNEMTVPDYAVPGILRRFASSPDWATAEKICDTHQWQQKLDGGSKDGYSAFESLDKWKDGLQSACEVVQAHTREEVRHTREEEVIQQQLGSLSYRADIYKALGVSK